MAEWLLGLVGSLSLITVGVYGDRWDKAVASGDREKSRQYLIMVISSGWCCVACLALIRA